MKETTTLKTVLITGCSSGIGLCTAQTLQQSGYRVFATVRKADDKQKLETSGLKTLMMDVSDSVSIRAALAELLQHTGNRLDILINNAGVGQPGALEDLSRETLQTLFATNVFGLMELTNAVIPVMRKQGHGRIINISSVLGLVVIPHHGAAYAASKFTVEALSDGLRMELHDSGIKVCLIEPGPIDTEFRRKSRENYQKNVDASKSQHQAFYQEWVEKTEQKKKESSLTQSPALVVKKIIAAIESKKPKARYYVTIPTYFLATLKRLLPVCCLDRILSFISRKI